MTYVPHFTLFKKTSFFLLLFLSMFLLGTSVKLSYAIALIVFFPAMLLISFNFRWSVFVLILASNLAIYVYGVMTLTSLTAFLCVYSFIITHNFSFKELKSPLTKPILLFFVCVIPSFLNTVVLTYSAILLSQLVALVALIHILRGHIESEYDIDYIISGFVFFVIVNVIFITVLGSITQKRLFGIGSVSFVDYANIGLIIFLNKVLYLKKMRVINILAIFFTVIAVVFTQTRSTLILASFILSLISFSYMYENAKDGIDKTVFVFRFLLGALILILLIAGLYKMFPSVFARFSSDQIAGSTLEAGSGNYSSLTTRFMIWDTAYNAFMAHPIIGIGWSSFPYSSSLYNQLPFWMFDIYVKHLSTHETFVSIITETGLVGLLGFLVLIIAQLRLSLRIRANKNTSPYHRNLTSWITIYIAFSMVFTDAWLYGDQIIIWGLFLGILLGYEKIMHKPLSKQIA